MSRLDDLKEEHRYLMLDTLEEWGYDTSDIKNTAYNMIRINYIDALNTKIEQLES